MRVPFRVVLPGIVAVIMALTPVFASAATQSGGTTINATISDIISMTTSGTVSVSLIPTSGGVTSSASDTVTVSTNRSTGYNLRLSSSDATNTLTSGANTIAAHTGTFGSPTVLAANTWGYRIVGVGGFGATAYSGETNSASSTSTWAGVPTNASPAQIKNIGSPVSGDVTTVWYGVRATTSKPNGVYTEVVTYTATTN